MTLASTPPTTAGPKLCALQFAAGRIKGTTFMRSFLFVNGSSRIDVELLPPLAGQTIWRLTATANGKAVADKATVPRDISVLLVPAAYGKHGRVEIDAGARWGFGCRGSVRSWLGDALQQHGI